MSIGHNGGPLLNGDSGWIAIARAMRNHPIVGFHLFAKPAVADKGATQPALAFIDLIMECRYESGFVMNGGRKMEIMRGQLVGAVSWLAARWNWTPMAVRVWLDKLESDGMISRFVPGASTSNKHNGKTSTVISVCNYDKYQSATAYEQPTEQQTNNKQATNEQQQYKENNLTKEQEVDLSSKPQAVLFAEVQEPKKPRGRNARKKTEDADFEMFWAIYPRKEVKLEAERKFAARKLEVGADALIEGARRYAASRVGQDPKFTAMPTTWLNQGRWADGAPATGAAPPPSAVQTGEGAVGPNGKAWGWWRKYGGAKMSYENSMRGVEKFRPNGTWPWWELGPPPGGEEPSILDPLVVARFGFENIYRGKVVHD
jgi:hypothetical protein